MIDLDPIENELMTECREDHVGLWAVISSVRDRFEEMSDAESHRVTLGIIRDLLASGRIGAGQFVRRSEGLIFEFWPLSPDEAVERIRSEWSALGRDPIPGEIVWLTSLEHGGAMPFSRPHGP